MVTDPTHPLFGKNLKLAGIASLPGHVRHCQVEIAPGQYGHIPVASTNLFTGPRPAPTVLTLTSIQDFVATFLALPTARRGKHATSHKSRRVGPSVAERARRGG